MSPDAADSAGVPWLGRTFHASGLEDDDGCARPALAAALTAYGNDRGTLPDLVDALSRSRLLVPVVATLAEAATADTTGLAADKTAEMAMVTLRGKDGRVALPVFSSASTLVAWDPRARPVPVDPRRAALSAVQEGAEVLVLDVAGPVTAVVPRPAVWAVAQGRRWTPAPQDAAVAAAVEAAAREEPLVQSVTCLPGQRAELRVVLAVRPGLDPAGLDAVTAALSRRLAENQTVAERVGSMEISITAAR